jgi:hypothetical protein
VVAAGRHYGATVYSCMPLDPESKGTAAHVRRPPVSPESPTLGLSHLQFKAMLVAARTSPNARDNALVVMLGLLRLRIFEACAATSVTWARSTATAS